MPPREACELLRTDWRDITFLSGVFAGSTYRTTLGYSFSSNDDTLFSSPNVGFTTTMSM